MVGGRRPLLPKILGHTDRVGAKLPIFLSIVARSASAVTPSEKSSVNTNRKFAFQLVQDEHRTLSL